jgi:serine/threonine protein kinase
LAYLHEGLEPKIVHRDIKSSSILLDRHWDSKVSDFGLAKLLCSDRSFVNTRVMGTFGSVLNERSQVAIGCPKTG